MNKFLSIVILGVCVAAVFGQGAEEGSSMYLRNWCHWNNEGHKCHGALHELRAAPGYFKPGKEVVVRITLQVTKETKENAEWEVKFRDGEGLVETKYLWFCEGGDHMAPNGSTVSFPKAVCFEEPSVQDVEMTISIERKPDDDYRLEVALYDDARSEVIAFEVRAEFKKQEAAAE